MESLQLKCRYCTASFSTLLLYLNHLPQHRHIISSSYPCGIQACKSILSNESCLRLHLIRQHGIFVKKSSFKSTPSSNSSGKYVCSVPHCSREMDTQKQLNSHLSDHLNHGIQVPCPHRGCGASYKKLNTFLNHLHKSHKPLLVEEDSVTYTCENNSSASLPSIEDHEFYPSLENDMHDIPDPIETSKRNLQVECLAQLFMKLEFQLLVPESTVNYIAKEIMVITQENYVTVEEDVRRHLQQQGVDLSAIDSVSKSVFRPFKTQFQSLRSSYLRKKFYKEMNFYAPPKLARAKGNSFYYYLSINDITLGLFKDKSDLHIQLDCPVNESEILRDFTDGFQFKNNIFFQQNPRSLKIIIYQDGFQVVCPIGPAKKLHKFIGIYISFGNMPDFLRTHPDNIFLLALLKQDDMDHKKVYGRIVEELKDLETNGIFVPGYGQIKGSLVFVAGDNLGSHSLGGFYESFGRTIYFCRYCYVDRPSFKREGGHNIDYPKRTPEEHHQCLQGRTLHEKKGVKFDSAFNELDNFHVANFGLVPCGAHDLAEGLCAADMALFIHYFVSKEWFTYEEYGTMIKSFPFSVKDNRDRPIEFLESYDGLKGGAMQIFNTIRLFPLIIKDYIKDKDEKVWKGFLLLTEIIEIIMAPAIRKSFLGYLDDIIMEYLDFRRECFPDVDLLPKHHYLSHYAYLIYLYGPLKKVWTLRHEMYQCYLRSGARDRCSVSAFSCSEFNPSMYSYEIQLALSEGGLPSQMEECASIKVKGTHYQKGNIVILSQAAYQSDIQMDRIVLLLFSGETVFFVVEVQKLQFIAHLRAYKLLGSHQKFICVNQESLLSYYAHHEYKLRDGNYIKLHHGLVA
ncbi:Transcription factor IIIA [Frankliniella fusca]|uniref:Transcription factor IIIA n=1 Tax=Frankliniella fusca TaxID=407009 RepID=A0AAE1LE63_9NEOP|nr:Transcription factor IIIA [Frankliniella fusca]